MKPRTIKLIRENWKSHQLYTPRLKQLNLVNKVYTPRKYYQFIEKEKLNILNWLQPRTYAVCIWMCLKVYFGLYILIRRTQPPYEQGYSLHVITWDAKQWFLVHSAAASVVLKIEHRNRAGRIQIWTTYTKNFSFASMIYKIM